MREMTVSHEPDVDSDTVDIVGDDLDADPDTIDKLAKTKGDRFAKSGDYVRGLNGLDTNTKRRVTRRINKYHKGSGGAESKQLHQEQLSGYAMFDVVEPPYNLDYLARLYEISPAHKAAVDAKVANVVGLGYHWEPTLKTQHKLERLEDDAEKIQRARRKLARAQEEMDEWSEDTNEEDTFEEVLRKMWTDVETMGNGYLEIGRKNTGEIGYIGHIPGNTIRIRTKRDGFVQIMDNRVTFFRNYGKENVDPIGGDRNPNEILHFKKYSPGRGYYGIPDILAARSAVAGNEFAARFNLDYFEHKAVPRYVVVLKGAKLGSDSEKKLVNFLTGIKGTHHRTIYIPLPGDRGEQKVEFKMEAVEANIQDSSFNNYHKANREDILMSHRVPMTKVGLTQDVNLAVARDADKMFKEQVTRPAQRILEKRVGYIFKEKTDALVFKLNELTLTDEDTMSKIHERYARMKAMDVNEIREAIGLPGHEGGDEPPDMGPARAREDRAQARGSRRRDQERAGGPDNSGEGRNAPGEGRSTT
jgi:PBSX family phage portal protein